MFLPEWSTEGQRLVRWLSLKHELVHAADFEEWPELADDPADGTNIARTLWLEYRAERLTHQHMTPEEALPFIRLAPRTEMKIVQLTRLMGRGDGLSRPWLPLLPANVLAMTDLMAGLVAIHEMLKASWADPATIPLIGAMLKRYYTQLSPLF